MPSPDSATASGRLRVIAGGAGRSLGLMPLGMDATPIEVKKPLTRRPGDHLELITLEGVDLRPIREAGCDRGICPETAVALVVERALVAEQLRINGLGESLIRLGHLAEATRARTPLWDAHSDYLRHLLGGAPGAPWARPLHSPRVSLPTRLIDRVALGIPDLGEKPAEALAAAVNWEIAALLKGETISEWAYRSALSSAP